MENARDYLLTADFTVTPSSRSPAFRSRRATTTDKSCKYSLLCQNDGQKHLPADTPAPLRPFTARRPGELAGQLATLSTEELAKILRVNHRIAATNRLRYSRFHDDAKKALPALAAYTGIVFKRIAPADFTAGDFEYAQAHLNITSFLYGLLRPLDAIRTYRLEGDAVLPGHGEQTVFEYWQDKLTDAFLRRSRPTTAYWSIWPAVR